MKMVKMMENVAGVYRDYPRSSEPDYSASLRTSTLPQEEKDSSNAARIF